MSTSGLKNKQWACIELVENSDKTVPIDNLPEAIVQKQFEGNCWVNIDGSIDEKSTAIDNWIIAIKQKMRDQKTNAGNKVSFPCISIVKEYRFRFIVNVI